MSSFCKFPKTKEEQIFFQRIAQAMGWGEHLLAFVFTFTNAITWLVAPLPTRRENQS